MQEIGEKVLSVRFFLLLFLKFLVIKQSFALALNFITSVTRIRLHGTLLHIGRINYIFAMEKRRDICNVHDHVVQRHRCGNLDSCRGNTTIEANKRNRLRIRFRSRLLITDNLANFGNSRHATLSIFDSAWPELYPIRVGESRTNVQRYR